MQRVGQVIVAGAVAATVLIAVVGGGSAVSAAGTGDTQSAVGGDTDSRVSVTGGERSPQASTAMWNGTAPTTAATRQGDLNVSIFVAPGDALSALRGRASISNYSAPVTLRPRPTLADTMIVRVSGPGLADAVAAQSGNTTRKRFFSLLATDRASLRLYEVAPTREGPFKAIDITDSDAVTVVPGPGNTFDLVTDPAALNGTLDRNGDNLPDEGADPVGIEPFDTYQFNFTFDGNSELKAISVFPVVATLAPDQPRNQPRLYPARNQEIFGTTTVAPGTELEVQLVVRGEGGFSQRRTVTVTNRTLSEFTATFDLRNASDDRNVSVVARLDGEPIGGTDGRILNLSASLTAPDRIDSRRLLEIRRTTLSQDGFVVVRPVGESRVVGRRYLTAGSHENVSVSLSQGIRTDTLNVTLYVDVDGDRRFDGSGPDQPYEAVFGPVSKTVRLGAPTTPVPTSPPPTTTVTTRPPTSPPPTTTVTTRPPTSPPGSPADPVTDAQQNTSTTFTPYTFTVEGAPGFGVGVALVALSLVALLARRRAD